MNPLPTACPICQASDLTVTGFFCRECDSRVEGRFLVETPFAGLTQEQMEFAATFIRCEGKFNRMEEELGLSYPTLRGRLHEMIRAMGFEPGRDEPAPLAEKARRQILAQLEAGEIDYEAAMEQLQGG
ncbi:MAG: DUF2089 domain-containing protein [Caldilineaceae bacterium]|nr:DUF2089 domain-containing protein [Caldilineaceae bacterium]MDE0080436.1 DUF2089 domain-containing protein [Caldilineaceae bacterium]